MTVLRAAIDLVRRHLGITRVEDRLNAALADLQTCLEQQADHVEQRDFLIKQMLTISYQAARSLAAINPPAVAAWPAMEPVGPDLDGAMARLSRDAPQAFALWVELLHVNSVAYQGYPVHSCSVAGHPSAQYFKFFVYPHLRGRVMDIGCGPQPVPLYLTEYPLDLVYGIDPISSPEDHPFHFVRGVSEYLPWADDVFDVVVAATSLDHVLLLDRTFAEVARTLTADGTFLVWVAFLDQAETYDPYDPELRPVDQYHLFHFSQATFEASLQPWFRIEHVSKVKIEIDHHFYVLRPRKT